MVMVVGHPPLLTRLGVDPHVTAEIAGLKHVDEMTTDNINDWEEYLGKSQGAELALVRLLSRMNPQVFGQGGRVRECLLAQPAPGYCV